MLRRSSTRLSALALPLSSSFLELFPGERSGGSAVLDGFTVSPGCRGRPERRWPSGGGGRGGARSYGGGEGGEIAVVEETEGMGSKCGGGGYTVGVTS